MPVEAPLGTAARKRAIGVQRSTCRPRQRYSRESIRTTKAEQKPASTVGLPRESKISRARTWRIWKAPRAASGASKESEAQRGLPPARRPAPQLQAAPSALTSRLSDTAASGSPSKESMPCPPTAPGKRRLQWSNA